MPSALARLGWRLALLLSLPALIGVGALAWQRHQSAALSGPITIGLLQALSGPVAASEAPQVAAARLAVQEINEAGGLLGRRVELKLEDTRADPRVAAAAADRLITAERAVALFGCGVWGCRQAVLPVVEARGHLLFHAAASEGFESSPHIVYTGPTPNQQALPAVHWAMQQFGRRVYVLGTEGMHSRRLAVVLRDFIMLGGGQVLGERNLALGAADVGGALADLARVRPDVLVSSVCGDGNRALFDGLVADGLSDLPLLSLCAAEPEMAALEGGRLSRHFLPVAYLQALSDPANQRFLERLRRSQGAAATASDAAVATYAAVHLWAASVREVGSERTDAVNATVVHQTFAAPYGFAAVDAQTRHLWRPLRIARVKVDGGLEEVLALPRYVRPEPWPTFRSTQHWGAVLLRTESRP